MPNQPPQPDYVSNTCRAISGQLNEWGIEFQMDRVAQLTTAQREELQTWINAGVDADEEYRAAFSSLPEFMERELLEMSGSLAGESQETIIEQAINAYEANEAITDNPYLFDTSAWHLWRTAYCRWHHGEPLEIPEQESEQTIQAESQNALSPIQQELIQLAPQLHQAESKIKQLRQQLKQTKRLRNSYRKQQTLLINQLCESGAPEVDSVSAEHTSETDTCQSPEPETAVASPATTPAACYSNIVRIPVMGPETNRIEVFLIQEEPNEWRAGHLWSVEVDPRTGQRSRGSKQPSQQTATYPTETAALINEVILLSQQLSGFPELERQIIDYLNRLEEFPGQISVCLTCERHFINDGRTEPDSCPQCEPE